MFPRYHAAILCCAVLAGCGDAEIVVQRQSSQAAFDAAVKAFESSHFSDAESQFNAAIDAGQLQPDQYFEAVVYRALSRAEIGQFGPALEDLDAITPHAPDLDRVHAARARVYLKQGERDRAAAEFQLAVKINPGTPALEGL
jgi:tetratricopeptide (TPR) repeat protein